jgi:hypothetical protein
MGTAFAQKGHGKFENSSITTLFSAGGCEGGKEDSPAALIVSNIPLNNKIKILEFILLNKTK